MTRQTDTRPEDRLGHGWHGRHPPPSVAQITRVSCETEERDGVARWEGETTDGRRFHIRVAHGVLKGYVSPHPYDLVTSLALPDRARPSDDDLRRLLEDDGWRFGKETD